MLDKLSTSSGQAERYRKVFDASQGFAVFNRVLQTDPDAAYYGTTVGPKDNGKVLLRWKLDDGRYQVIFGDLRDETVSAEKLRVLEGKQTAGATPAVGRSKL